MHIGKTLNKDICTSLTIDVWDQKVFEKEIGDKELVFLPKTEDFFKMPIVNH